MGHVTNDLRAQALNMLRIEKKINVHLTKNNNILYELVIEEKSPDDIVLALIEDSGKNGIWIRDIRGKSKLSQIILNKALKSLENKKLIRPIKSISNRKLYVIFDLEPDESITGGACYESGYIREDIVKNLKSTCFQYFYDLYHDSYKQTMANLSDDNTIVEIGEIYATALDVFQHFLDRNIFLDIKLGDIEHILNILYYECKLNKLASGNKTQFRYNPYNRDKTDMFYAPCLVCHLYKDCKPGSVNISPKNCHYLKVDIF